MAETQNDVKSVIQDTLSGAIDAGKAVAKAYSGDIAGATVDAVKALRKLLPIIGIILFLIIFFFSFIFSAPAMIWDNLKEGYHNWTMTKCVEAIEDAFDKSATDACTTALEGFEYYIPDYEVIRNSFFEDGQGGLGVIYLEDGSTFTAQIDNTEPSFGKDMILKYYNADTKEYTEIRYVDGNNFYNSPLNISYAEIINGFALYRGKQEADRHEYTPVLDPETGQIIGVEKKKDEQGNEIELDAKDFAKQAFGLTDYAALYHFINKSENSDQIYQIKYALGTTGTVVDTINNKNAKDTANNPAKVKEIQDAGQECKGYYQIVMSVETFDSEVKPTTDERYTYSAFTQSLFNLTDEEMDEVAQRTAISNYIINSVLDDFEDVPDDMSEYFTFSPAKKVFENIMGGHSVLQQMTEDGLIMGDFNEATCRNIVAGKAASSKKVSVSYNNFFGITTGDTYTKAFGENMGTDDSHPGDPAMFATWVFYSALANDNVTLRDGLFPTTDGKIVNSTASYYHFFKNNNSFYNNRDDVKIEKGDIIFTAVHITPCNVGTDVGTAPDGTINPPDDTSDSHPYNTIYQMGIVTKVQNNLVTCVIYNFDENLEKYIPEGQTFDATKMWIYAQFFNNDGHASYKTSEITFDLNNTSASTTASGTTYGLNNIFGFGKPDYAGFVKEYNDKYAEHIEELKKAQSVINPNMGTGQFSYPCDPNTNITAGYGKYPTRREVHTGVDFGLSQGSNVYAAESGTVVKAVKRTDSYGFHIIIEHSGGLQTIYAHNSELYVKAGDKVTKGQLIAKSGNTGNSTGPHLHFEVRMNGQHTDPMKYLSK